MASLFGEVAGNSGFVGERRGSHIESGLNTSRRGSHIESISKDPTHLHPSDDLVRRASVNNPDFGGLVGDSKDATNHETTMTVAQGLKLYKKGVCWSLWLSTAIIMEGYDVVLLANFYGLNSFNREFGDVPNPDPTGPVTTPNIVSAPWRSGLSNGALIGEIIGLFFTGIAQDRYGFKKTIGTALVAMICFIFITFFAQNLPMLLAGEILCGLSWGVFQTITTAYASEVMPVVLRCYLTTYVNLCWVLGQLVGSGVLRGVYDLGDDQLGWKIPFAIQWVWPVPILVGCILCPESPWWLVRHGRFEDAKHSLRRLTSAGVDPTFDVDKTIAMMEHTNSMEKEMSTGTSYFDCFKGYDLRRTEITCFAWLVQTICGSTFMGYSTTFYQAAGLSGDGPFNLSIGQYALGACGTFLSWFLMSYIGRRKIYLFGTLALFILLIIIGALGSRSEDTGAQWAIGSMLLIFTFVYDFSVGPVCYSIVAEIPSTRLKAKTIVLSRNLYNVGGVVVNVLTNYQLTPTAWDWGAYSGFFWAGTCFIALVWIFFRLPEPKGRTYGELDILFENKVNARKFASTNVDFFRGDTIAVVESDEMGKPRRQSVVDFEKGGASYIEKKVDAGHL